MRHRSSGPRADQKRAWGFNKMLPNIVTLSALCIGSSSIKYALEGGFQIAAMCILIASLLDVLDGRIARILNSTSYFGAQLDSLCDVVNFIVLPAIVNYVWLTEKIGATSDHYMKFIWSSTLVYISCGALRLARFNTIDQEQQNKKVTSKAFLGVPSTFGGILILTPMMIDFSFNITEYLYIELIITLSTIYTSIIGILMISKLKTPSTKGIAIDSRNVALYFSAMAFSISLILFYPWMFIPFFNIIYLLFLPFYHSFAIKQSKNS